MITTILGSRDRANSQKILIIPELCSPTKITRLFFSISFSPQFCCFSLSVSHSSVSCILCASNSVRLRFYSISFVAVFSSLSPFFFLFSFLHCELFILCICLFHNRQWFFVHPHFKLFPRFYVSNIQIFVVAIFCYLHTWIIPFGFENLYLDHFMVSGQINEKGRERKGSFDS